MRDAALAVAQRHDDAKSSVAKLEGELRGLEARRRSLTAELEYANTLPPKEAERVLDRVVILDLFATGTLPRLQVLAPEEGVDTELQAYEIAGIITNELDNGGLGIRQEAILHKVIEALIRAGLPLTVLPAALEPPGLLDALAEKHGPPDFFHSVAARLRKESRDRILGLVSRADRLLRLRSVRLALGGSPNRIDFAKLLDDRITLINLAPPQGSTDIGRFMADGKKAFGSLVLVVALPLYAAYGAWIVVTIVFRLVRWFIWTARLIKGELHCPPPN